LGHSWYCIGCRYGKAVIGIGHYWSRPPHLRRRQPPWSYQQELNARITLSINTPLASRLTRHGHRQVIAERANTSQEHCRTLSALVIATYHGHQGRCYHGWLITVVGIRLQWLLSNCRLTANRSLLVGSAATRDHRVRRIPRLQRQVGSRYTRSLVNTNAYRHRWLIGYRCYRIGCRDDSGTRRLAGCCYVIVARSLMFVNRIRHWAGWGRPGGTPRHAVTTYVTTRHRYVTLTVASRCQ